MKTENNSDYVNREEQIRKAESRLYAMRHGQPVYDSILEWYGIPGIGKTTLVQKAIASYCQETNIPFSCVDFSLDRNPKAQDYPVDPKLLIEIIFEQLEIDSTPITDPISKSDILRRLRPLLQQGPIVIAFDTTEEVNTKLVVWIEENLIAPLLKEAKVLFIWTGRFKQQWHIFEVGSRVVSKKLAPLDREATQEQKNLYGEGIGEVDVYSITFGHPLANKALFQLLVENPRANKQHLIDEVNNAVVDKLVMDNVEGDLNQACRVLSVVRQFDFVMVKQILSRFVESFKDRQNIYPMKIVNRLTSTALVEWDAVRKGYALDETIRHILALHLRTKKSDKYLYINNLAADIYEDWIERVPENRSIYILEWLYHQVNIYSLQNIPLDQLVDKLEVKLCEYLEKYYSGTDQESALVSTNKLHKELESDTELCALLDGFQDKLPDDHIGENAGRLLGVIANHRDTLAK
jgi:hypothetical protein